MAHQINYIFSVNAKCREITDVSLNFGNPCRAHVSFATKALLCNQCGIFLIEFIYIGITKEVKILLRRLACRIQVGDEFDNLSAVEPFEFLFQLSFRHVRLFFEPLVKPAEEQALPHHGILGLEYPVIFIGEYYHLGGNTAQLGGIECLHALRGKDAVVILAMAYHDRSGPAVDIAVG